MTQHGSRLTKRFIVRGRVQGVGFRWFVEREARQLSMNGEEICEIFMALDTQRKWIEKSMQDSKENAPDIVPYWESRLEAVQNIRQSFYQKIFPSLEAVS